MVPAENGCPKTLFDMGLTDYLDNIQPCLPTSPLVLQALERNLGIPPGTARIGAFASPPGDGAACHYYTEDMISIQLTGSKAFHVAPVEQVRYPIGMQYSPGAAPYSDLYPQVAGHFPDWDNAKFECVEMRPGSVLFMPRGTWHRTEADEPSLSITIAMRPPSARNDPGKCSLVVVAGRRMAQTAIRRLWRYGTETSGHEYGCRSVGKVAAAVTEADNPEP